MKTGAIEIIASELRILSESETTPFQVEDDDITVKDDLRLKYRYIDLRRPCQLKNIVMRHKTAQVIRNFLRKKDFGNRNPYARKSTPEGARDYLVQAVIHNGKFYGLPQSPSFTNSF